MHLAAGCSLYPGCTKGWYHLLTVLEVDIVASGLNCVFLNQCFKSHYVIYEMLIQKFAHNLNQKQHYLQYGLWKFLIIKF